MAGSFFSADLTGANFEHSNLKRTLFQFANLKGVNFSHANLYGAIFIATAITDKQLESALSIQDALLPNNTRARDENLINKGASNCHISHENGWILQNGNVIAVESNHSDSYCEFILQTVSTGASMHQRINLSNKWNSTIWPYSQVVLRASMSIGVSMELNGINNNNQILDRQTLSKFHYAGYRL